MRGPYGTHWPLAEAEQGDVIVMAGGLGLPPLRPAIYHLLAHRDRYRRVVLLYGARTPADLLFPGELAAWRSRFIVEVLVTVDAATSSWRNWVTPTTARERTARRRRPGPRPRFAPARLHSGPARSAC